MNRYNTKKVLLVDDEPNILTALEFILKQQGLKVDKAMNGERALHMMEIFRPNIVVLDVMMPGMDGFEVAKTIRSNPNYEDVRIIFLTAKGTIEDKMTGYANGGEIYLTKPFENEEVIQIINEVVEFGI